MGESVGREKAAALQGLRRAAAVEADLRARLKDAVEHTGVRLMVARDLEVPWAQCTAALGVKRDAANVRWRAARDQAAEVGRAEAADSVDPVLSGLARRWGGTRPLREFQALEVAAEAGAAAAGELERRACEGEPGRRPYEIDELVAQTCEGAAAAGRAALLELAAAGRAVPMLEAWSVVSEAAAGFLPSWRAATTAEVSSQDG